MLERLAAGREIQRVIVDPSAASFIETLRQRGWRRGFLRRQSWGGQGSRRPWGQRAAICC